MAGKEEFPHLEEISNRVDDVFKQFTDGGSRMTFPQFRNMLEDVDKGLRALPATAQVAKQEGSTWPRFLTNAPAMKPSSRLTTLALTTCTRGLWRTLARTQPLRIFQDSPL